MNREKKKAPKWAIVLVLLVWIFIIICATNLSDNSTTQNNVQLNSISDIAEEKEIYNIIGEEIGKYGKKVILNANTDSPTEKYLYKIPSGTYQVTTTDLKYSTFWIVKDNIVKTGTEQYPEELEYVGEQQMLTANNDNLNGQAKKVIEITINDDESIQTVGKSVLTFEKK